MAAIAPLFSGASRSNRGPHIVRFGRSRPSVPRSAVTFTARAGALIEGALGGEFCMNNVRSALCNCRQEPYKFGPCLQLSERLRYATPVSSGPSALLSDAKGPLPGQLVRPSARGRRVHGDVRKRSHDRGRSAGGSQHRARPWRVRRRVELAAGYHQAAAHGLPRDGRAESAHFPRR
ncbi:hypothetical protein BVI434_410119 [Burkholderia vietnamiensis]|nr:hypothetical protein BVI434_410119 [Burkholderia vietnamiensis]